MSDIKVGDLVMVIRWCCASGPQGAIFTVAGVANTQTHQCRHCWEYLPVETFPVSAGAPEVRNGAPISWLKRIPPLDELERDQLVKELTV